MKKVFMVVGLASVLVVYPLRSYAQEESANQVIQSQEAIAQKEEIAKEEEPEAVKQSEPLGQEKLLKPAVKAAEQEPGPGDLLEELEELNDQIELMKEGIDDFIKFGKNKDASGNEIQAQFGNFQQEINASSAQVDAFFRAADSILNRGEAYFEQWQKELEVIRNSSLRKRGERKKDKELRNFLEFDEVVEKTKEDLEDFVIGLEDIVRYLRFDLTIKNIASVFSEFS